MQLELKQVLVAQQFIRCSLLLVENISNYVAERHDDRVHSRIHRRIKKEADVKVFGLPCRLRCRIHSNSMGDARMSYEQVPELRRWVLVVQTPEGYSSHDVLPTHPRVDEVLRVADITTYLDECIMKWREALKEGGENSELAPYYVDAYQSVRSSLAGEILPSVEE